MIDACRSLLNDVIACNRAPTRLAWCNDNRTTSFRVVGEEEATRIEVRVPGADCNFYLALAALIGVCFRLALMATRYRAPECLCPSQLDCSRQTTLLSIIAKTANSAFTNTPPRPRQTCFILASRYRALEFMPISTSLLPYTNRTPHSPTHPTYPRTQRADLPAFATRSTPDHLSRATCMRPRRSSTYPHR